MSANFLAKKLYTGNSRWGFAVFLLLWVLGGYILAQAILIGLIWVLTTFGVSFSGINQAVLGAVLSASVYLLSILIILGVPWLLKRRATTLEQLGLQRLPGWRDIGLAPAGFVVYLVGSVVLLAVVSQIVPGLDADQAQQTGFEGVTHRYEYILAFVTLVVIAPLAEELLFRGYLYGKIRTKVPTWAAILLVSLLFAAVHGQWNVAIDVFALSIVLCVLREITGSIWSSVLLHTLKNGIAFYFLFINPAIL